MSPPLPSRWLNCPRKSINPIAGKFVAFKTPLSNHYDSKVPLQYRFTPALLFQSLQDQKIKLGLWIDLTNTTRYYDKKTVEEAGVKYIKLNCKGHGEVPTDDQVRTFIKLCSMFIRKQPLECIGVHCTHGFNRTGLLIVSYLVEKMDWSAAAAVRAFQEQRPPGIYKPDYLKAIFDKYGDEDMPPVPDYPEWSLEDGNESEDTSNKSGSSSGANMRKRTVHSKQFLNGDVPGVMPVTDSDVINRVHSKLRQLCEYTRKDFPGSQPVSLTWENIGLLQQEAYMVTWKADGTRYMLLIDGPDQVYFVDRDNCVFQIKGLSFPVHNNLQGHLHDTLLDGEMVFDQVKGGHPIPRYLIYDIVHLQDTSMKKEFLDKRLKCIEEHIIKPRIAALKKGILRRDKEPLGVRAKRFCGLEQTAQFLSPKFQEQVSHEVDGLIFQPVQEPYMTGCCPQVLKWKPPHLNTIDFRLVLAQQQGEGVVPHKVAMLYVGGHDAPFAHINKCKALKQYHKQIVECAWNMQSKSWEVLRVRTDKSFPNSYLTAASVAESIKKPVLQEELLRAICPSVVNLNPLKRKADVTST